MCYVTITGTELFLRLRCIKEEKNDVRLGEATEGLLLHTAPQSVTGLLRAGSIHENCLVTRAVADPANGTARRLRTGRGDGNLRAHEPIDQCRFTHVRTSQDRHKAALEVLCRFFDHRFSEPKAYGSNVPNG